LSIDIGSNECKFENKFGSLQLRADDRANGRCIPNPGWVREAGEGRPNPYLIWIVYM
jgi:hypothetical protein